MVFLALLQLTPQPLGSQKVFHTNLEGGIKSRDVDDIDVNLLPSMPLQNMVASSQNEHDAI